MIKLTCEQKEENRELRHQIIDEIMEMQDTEALNSVYIIAKANSQKELMERIMTLDEAVSMLDPEAVSKLYRLFAGDKENRAVGEQVTELCRDAMEHYVRAGGSLMEIAGSGEELKK